MNEKVVLNKIMTMNNCPGSYGAHGHEHEQNMNRGKEQ